MSEKGHQDDGGNERKTTSSRLWTPYSDPRERGYRAAAEDTGTPRQAGETHEDQVSDEEMRARIEEALERLTVADVVVDMVVSLSSLAYRKMGIPKEVNEKYRDMDQARLAIDSADALVEVIADRVPGDILNSLRGTIDNLKLNFAKES